MRAVDNTIVYASLMEKTGFRDVHTFAHLFFRGIWHVTKYGYPNCILQSYADDGKRVAVSVCGLTKLKITLSVKPAEHLALKDDKMCMAVPGTHFPLVQVLEEGASGQAVWVKWV